MASSPFIHCCLDASHRNESEESHCEAKAKDLAQASGHADKGQSPPQPEVMSQPEPDYSQPYSQWREEAEADWVNWDWPPHPNWRPSPHHRGYWDKSSPYYKYNNFTQDDPYQSGEERQEQPSLVRTPSQVSISTVGPSASLVAAQLQRCSTPEQTCLSPRFDESASSPTESELVGQAREERLKAQEMLSEAQLLLDAAKAVAGKNGESDKTNQINAKEKEMQDLKEARENIRALENKFDELRSVHKAAKEDMEQDLKRAGKLLVSFTPEQQKYAWTHDIAIASAHRCEAIINKAVETRVQKYDAKRELENASMQLGDIESAIQNQEVEETLRNAEDTQVVDAEIAKQEEKKQADEAAARKAEDMKKAEEAERQRAEAAKREEEERQAKEKRKAEETKKAEEEEEEAERQRAEAPKQKEQERQAKEAAARKAEEIKEAEEGESRRRAEAAKREEEERQAKEKRKAEEMKKAEEAERQRAEAPKQEEQERQAKEAAASKAEEVKKAEEGEAAKREEEERQAKEKRKAEEMKKAEEAKRQRAEAPKQEEQERQAKEAAARKAEETKKAEEGEAAKREEEERQAKEKRKAEEMKKAEEAKRQRAEAPKQEEQERQAKEAGARKAEEMKKAAKREEEKAKAAKQEESKKAKEAAVKEPKTIQEDNEKQSAEAMMKKAQQMMKEAENIMKNRATGGKEPNPTPKDANNGKVDVEVETPEEKKKREDKEKRKAEHHVRYMRYYRNIRSGGPTLGGCVSAP